MHPMVVLSFALTGNAFVGIAACAAPQGSIRPGAKQNRRNGADLRRTIRCIANRQPNWLCSSLSAPCFRPSRRLPVLALSPGIKRPAKRAGPGTSRLREMLSKRHCVNAARRAAKSLSAPQQNNVRRSRQRQMARRSAPRREAPWKRRERERWRIAPNGRPVIASCERATVTNSSKPAGRSRLLAFPRGRGRPR